MSECSGTNMLTDLLPVENVGILKSQTTLPFSCHDQQHLNTQHYINVLGLFYPLHCLETHQMTHSPPLRFSQIESTTVDSKFTGTQTRHIANGITRRHVQTVSYRSDCKNNARWVDLVTSGLCVWNLHGKEQAAFKRTLLQIDLKIPRGRVDKYATVRIQP